MGVLIIAEAGVNHNGSMILAKKMIDEAKEAGVDYVKFQTFRPEKLVSKFADKADYQKETTGASESQLEMLQKLALSEQNFIELKSYCETKKIGFLSTPFDLESIDFLNDLGIDFWKVPSGEITNLPYLEKIAKTGKQVVMSTGMCQMSEIADAVNSLQRNGSGEISLLHCNTEYPTPFSDVNLRAMQTLKEKFGLTVGYSDHTLGIEVPIAAVALGARIIEKHFTLDKTMEGPDQPASLEPDELKNMVSAIRNIEHALGDGEKKPSLSELKNITIARKSIVAKEEIAAGEYFSEKNLTVKRPGNGMSPMKWHEVIGMQANRGYTIDEVIDNDILGE